MSLTPEVKCFIDARRGAEAGYIVREESKLIETLLSREEMASAEDLGDYYRVPPDSRSLDYDKFVETGEVRISESQDFNSHNAVRLDVQATKHEVGSKSV